MTSQPKGKVNGEDGTVNARVITRSPEHTSQLQLCRRYNGLAELRKHRVLSIVYGNSLRWKALS